MRCGQCRGQRAAEDPRASLPSWAWSGWRGRLLWKKPSTDPEVLAWVAKSTWIVWYVRGSTGSPKLIWDAVRSDRSAAVAPTEQILAERMTKIRGFSADVLLPTQPSREIPRTMERQSNLLQFWTFSASFRLRVDRRGERYLRGLDFAEWKVALEIYDGNDEYSGFIYVDEESSKHDYDEAELIIISKNAMYIDTDYAFTYSSKAPLKREHAGWHNVLFIGETEGIAEHSAWKWKEIVLG
ncbi:hypothetical protein ONZ43_g7347 [Nemania bipapillata]|uniref:Uncharacterized protein n=1 Tax=Nemania bipapillata TaxID=110536 RepID=A0ACC2HRP1_9PEZI|nr:hypothetical protein ONZ43_g7347 [Nemania bipapillata]